MAQQEIPQNAILVNVDANGDVRLLQDWIIQFG
jgi:hypothetical protein